MPHSSFERSGGFNDLPDFSIAPAQPQDSETLGGVTDRLALWKAQETAATQPLAEAADVPYAERPIEARLAYQRALHQAWLGNIYDGIREESDLEATLSRNGMLTMREFIEAEEASLQNGLARSTPDEQENILMRENCDWHSWLAKFAGDKGIESHREFLHETREGVLEILARYPGSNSSLAVPPELTPDEERLDYWRWLAATFLMNASDLQEALSTGQINDPIARQVLAEYSEREARNRYGF